MPTPKTTSLLNFIWIWLFEFSDHNGKLDKAFMTAGYNDTDAGSSTTYLATGGFKGKDHPKECLKFYYIIGVSNLV